MCIRDYGGVIRTIITADKAAEDVGGDERVVVKRPDNIITVERGLRREVKVLDVGNVNGYDVEDGGESGGGGKFQDGLE